ncbi:hypothetical protein KEJ44_08480 [Candidatus Bathyarchaeota archaeon]|nr:hypothetical protein [Candidatus Bathyarchaeota archaeon]
MINYPKALLYPIHSQKSIKNPTIKILLRASVLLFLVRNGGGGALMPKYMGRIVKVKRRFGRLISESLRMRRARHASEG